MNCPTEQASRTTSRARSGVTPVGGVRPCPVPWRLRSSFTCSAIVHVAPRTFLTWSATGARHHHLLGMDAEALACEVPEVVEVAVLRPGQLLENELRDGLQQVLRRAEEKRRVFGRTTKADYLLVECLTTAGL